PGGRACGTRGVCPPVRPTLGGGARPVPAPARRFFGTGVGGPSGRRGGCAPGDVPARLSDAGAGGPGLGVPVVVVRHRPERLLGAGSVGEAETRPRTPGGG